MVAVCAAMSVGLSRECRKSVVRTGRTTAPSRIVRPFVFRTQSSSGSSKPDVPVNPPVQLDLLDVVVRFGEWDVLGEDVGIVAAGGSPVVDVAVAGVVRGQGAIDRAVALQALGKVEAAE